MKCSSARRHVGVESLESRRLQSAAIPHFDHIIVVVEENHAASEIIGSPSAPYINALAGGGALFTRSFAVSHPSQPNYLALFSGSAHGTKSDTIPTKVFTTPNLAASLNRAKKTFIGYSESEPSAGYLGDGYSTVAGQNQYMRKHNPWSDWQAVAPKRNQLPASDNEPFTAFPSDFTKLPSVSFVVPNEQNDMHDGTIAAGDTWLSDNIGAYATWAKTHNSLLIVTWDEDDHSHSNQIATIFSGAMVRPGIYSEKITHYNVLRTIEASQRAKPVGNSAAAAPINVSWV